MKPGHALLYKTAPPLAYRPSLQAQLGRHFLVLTACRAGQHDPALRATACAAFRRVVSDFSSARSSSLNIRGVSRGPTSDLPLWFQHPSPGTTPNLMRFYDCELVTRDTGHGLSRNLFRMQVFIVSCRGDLDGNQQTRRSEPPPQYGSCSLPPPLDKGGAPRNARLAHQMRSVCVDNTFRMRTPLPPVCVIPGLVLARNAMPCFIPPGPNLGMHGAVTRRKPIDNGPAGHFKFLRVRSVKFLHPRGRTW